MMSSISPYSFAASEVRSSPARCLRNLLDLLTVCLQGLVSCSRVRRISFAWIGCRSPALHAAPRLGG